MVNDRKNKQNTLAAVGHYMRNIFGPNLDLDKYLIDFSFDIFILMNIIS